MSPAGERYVGLISGTSLDGIDAVVVDFARDGRPTVLAARTFPYESVLRELLARLCQPGPDEIPALMAAEARMADALADAVAGVLAAAGVTPETVTAIGSHGQTVRHLPDTDYPATLQVGDPNRLAERTGITTVADFRRRDMAAGGQGAPLVPALHAALFRDHRECRVVLNLGGIANITVLPTDSGTPVTGFDTGPANTLLDAWNRHQGRGPVDRDGAFAATGRVLPELLATLQADPYFGRPAPKSTGPEHFNLEWLLPQLPAGADPADVQATLVELTASTVARAIGDAAAGAKRVLCCGGGVHNPVLMARLAAQLPGREVVDTGAYGLAPDWVEAVAFAWLARQTLGGWPGNEPDVTGAARPVVLGGIYPGGPGQRLSIPT